MNAASNNAKQKLDEAYFYLQLMDRIEMGRHSLTANRDPKTEFSYLLSAFLNACYSSTEHLKQEKANVEVVKQFRIKCSEFYGSGPNGGWRTRTVHFRNVEPAHDGYVPPPGNNVIIRFRDTSPAEPQNGGSIALKFRHGNYYFSDQGPQNSICDLCAVHLGQLRELINGCA